MIREIEKMFHRSRFSSYSRNIQKGLKNAINCQQKMRQIEYDKFQRRAKQVQAGYFIKPEEKNLLKGLAKKIFKK